jgi:hypothetical protein
MEDDDTTGSDFFRLGDSDDGPVVSRDAFQLHSFGIVNSVRDGTPGFIPDGYLNAISAESTTTAMELCLVGLWERDDERGGYVIHDPMVEEAVGFQERLDVNAAFCESTGGHVPDADKPRICGKCGAPLD